MRDAVPVTDAPSVKPLVCPACGRALRLVTVGGWFGPDELAILGGNVSGDGSRARMTSSTQALGEDGQPTGKTHGHRNAAYCYDASDDGWNPNRPPSRYRFICEGRRHRVSRVITATKLKELYRDAVRRGLTHITLP